MAPNTIDHMDVLGKGCVINDENRHVLHTENRTLKRAGPQCINSPKSKRRRTLSEDFEHRSPMLDIIRAVENLSTDSTLIADGSRVSCLPTIEGKHKDLKSISPKIMSDVLKGQYDSHIDRVTVVDCRYPYEYDGGHIDGAVNLYTKDAIQNFINGTKVVNGEVHVLIFHCEFSSERGPKMFRFLRELDREKNEENYPQLNFPEVYLLEGGYKPFTRHIKYSVNHKLMSPCCMRIMGRIYVTSGLSLNHGQQETNNDRHFEEELWERNCFYPS